MDAFFVLQRGFDLTRSLSSEGTYPVYSSSGISYYHSEAKVKAPGIVTGRKGSVGPVFFVEEDFWPHDTTLWVKDFKENLPAFVYHFLTQFGLERFDESSSVPTLNRNNIHREPVAFPSLPEQRKIADFLTAVDGRIQQLSQKKALLQDYKKGVMQQLFTQALRFKDEHGNDFPDCEAAEFGKIAKRSSEKHNPMACETDYPSIELESLGQGTGQLLELFSSTDQKSIKSKFVKGDVLFGKLRPYLCKWLMAPFDGVCSSEIWVLRGRIVTNPYLYYLIQTDVFMKATNVSSGSKMPRADWAHIAAVSFSFPTSPTEQTKIASFLTALDRKIQSVANQITHTQTFKRGLLQQMFV